MKFLLNMNVPRELGKRLTVEGHECRHLGDIGMACASDFYYYISNSQCSSG